MFQMTIDIMGPHGIQTVNTKTYEFKHLDDAGPTLRNYKSYAQVLGLSIKLVGIIEVDD